MPLAADLFHYMAGWATKIEGNTINISVPYMPGANFHSYTLREPVGVVRPDHPVELPAADGGVEARPGADHRQLPSCSSPAEQTPLSALLLAQLIAEAGMPDGVVNVVTGFGETAGAALAAHDDVDKVAFTGSTEVGKLIVQAAAGNLKKVTLELGGKSPNIVFDDADAGRGRGRGECDLLQPRPVLRGRIPAVRPAGPVRRGGRWRGRDRQVDQARPGHGRRHPDGPAGLRGAAAPGHRLPRLGRGRRRHNGDRRRPVGDQRLLRRADRHHQHSPRHEDRPRGDLRAGGGGRPVPEPGRDRRGGQRHRYGLGAGIWTKDISKAHALAKKLRAGTVWINCYNVFDASLPFGGYKQSGWGREMGHEVLEAYTEVKAVTTLL